VQTCALPILAQRESLKHRTLKRWAIGKGKPYIYQITEPAHSAALSQKEGKHRQAVIIPQTVSRAGGPVVTGRAAHHPCRRAISHPQMPQRHTGMHADVLDNSVAITQPG